MRVILLMLPLALLLSTMAFANSPAQASPALEELEAAIFVGAPNQSVDQLYSWGVCAVTCEPCWGSCAPIGGRPQACVWACN